MPSIPAEEYEPGAIKRHPDWPSTKFLAVRTIFSDTDATACTSWLKVSPSVGIVYVTSEAVNDWPDVPNPAS